MLKIRLLIATASVVLISSLAHAHNPPGDVFTKSVCDSMGKPVTLDLAKSFKYGVAEKGLNTSITKEIIENNIGDVSLTELSPGRYSITYSADLQWEFNLCTVERNGVSVEVYEEIYENLVETGLTGYQPKILHSTAQVDKYEVLNYLEIRVLDLPPEATLVLQQDGWKFIDLSADLFAKYFSDWAPEGNLSTWVKY